MIVRNICFILWWVLLISLIITVHIAYWVALLMRVSYTILMIYGVLMMYGVTCTLVVYTSTAKPESIYMWFT